MRARCRRYCYYFTESEPRVGKEKQMDASDSRWRCSPNHRWKVESESVSNRESNIAGGGLGERVHSRFHTARSKKDMEKHNNSTSPRSNRSSVPEHLEGIHSRALLLSSFDTQPFFQFNQSNRILAFFSLVPAPCIVVSHCLCLFASFGNFGS